MASSSSSNSECSSCGCRSVSPATSLDPEEGHRSFSVEEELRKAREYIHELEMRFKSQERELKLAQDKARKSTQEKIKVRKLARCGDLFRPSVPDFEPSMDYDANPSDRLGEFFLLSITNVSQPSTTPTSSSLSQTDLDEPRLQYASLPFYLQKLLGQVFVVGPKGATIGTGVGCSIWLPREAGIEDEHVTVGLEHAPSSGDDSGFVYKLRKGSSSGAGTIILMHPVPEDNFTLPCTLENGTKFLTGSVEWTVGILPKHKILSLKLFAAVRKRSWDEFKSVWNLAEKWNEKVSLISHSVERQARDGSDDDVRNRSNMASQIVDINRDEDHEYEVVDDYLSYHPHYFIAYRPENKKRKYSYAHFTSSYSEDKIGKFPLLHIATDFSCLEIVKLLLEHGAEVNKRSGLNKYTALHIAARHGNAEIVQELLKFGADVELADGQGCLPVSMTHSYEIRKLLLSAMLLCSAAAAGDLHEVHRILGETDVNVNVKAFGHHTPLQLACLHGHVDVVQYLLEEDKALVNLKGGQYKRTALHYASLTDNLDIAVLLITYGADVGIVDSIGYKPIDLARSKAVCELLHKGNLSLHLAVQCGLVEQVIVILEFSNSADLNKKNDKGLAPIHIAAASGNVEMLEVLHGYGARLNIKGGSSKMTPLFYASLAGYSDAVSFLLMAGADLKCSDIQGLTVVDQVEKSIEDVRYQIERFTAVNREQKRFSQELHSSVVSELVALPQFVRRPLCVYVGQDDVSWLRTYLNNLQDVLDALQSLQQKLVKALESKNLFLLRILLQNEHLNVNGPLSKSVSQTPLDYCASMGMSIFVEALLEHGANPYVEDSSSYTPIHTAAQCGHDEVLPVLVKHGVSVDLITRVQGYTPLHIAVMSNRNHTVHTLLDMGADVSITDLQGRKAFHLANDFSLQRLLAHGSDMLYVAVLQQDLSRVEELIEKEGVDVNTTFLDGETALHAAAETGNLKITEYLIKKGAAVNAQTVSGKYSPLHVAAEGSDCDVVELLLSHGADLRLTDAKDRTPFEVASGNPVRRAIVNSRALQVKQPSLSSSEEHGDMCRICFSAVINSILLPCGHQAFCQECAARLRVCAFCRKTVSQVVPVFYAGTKSEILQT